MDFSGKIIAVLPVKSGTSKTGNTWTAQEYVIENHDQYPRRMCFEVFGTDKIQQFDIKAGEEVTVSFDIDARQWNDRWFNSIRAWRVERAANGGAMPTETMSSGASIPPPFPTTDAPAFTPNDAKDDLPF